MAETHQKAIDHVAAWLFSSNRVIFTGRTKNSNKMAKPRDVFEICLRYDTDFWNATYGYMPINKRPGQKGEIFGIFRDVILLPALCLCHARQFNVMPQVQKYLYKNVKLRDANLAPRAILGWELVVVDSLGLIAQEYGSA